MMAFIFALLPAFFAIFPVFGERFIPTHDGEYHIIRFWQFYTSLASKDWFPRWAPDLNYGFGIPLFTFQYPFPNYVGSLFHFLGLSYVDSVKWTLGFGYLIALTFCHMWVRRIFRHNVASIVATITCAFVPYWFVDIYIRGSVGEVWGLAWVFASLYAITAKKRLFTVITVGLLVLSHNIMALICIPMLLLYAGLFNPLSVLDIVLGLGASSYFWFPALYEQRFIQGISQVDIFDYFPRIDQLLIPSWGSGFRGQVDGGNEMSYQIGLIPLLTGIFILIRFIRHRKDMMKHKELCFAVFFLFLAVFLMTPWSMPLWKIVPLVHFIQYPWRLLSLVVIMTPILTGYVASKFRFGWLIAVAAILVSYGYTRPVTYEKRTDAYYLEQPSFTKGTSSMGNAFQTKWLRAQDTPKNHSFSVSSGTVRVAKNGMNEYHLIVEATNAGELSMPVAYYPGWTSTLPSGNIAGFANADGLLSFSVPQGRYEAVIRLELTVWQRVAAYVSIFSLSVAVVSFILRKYYAG